MRLIGERLPVIVCLLVLFCFRIPTTDGVAATDEILEEASPTEEKLQEAESAIENTNNGQADEGDVLEAPSEQDQSTGAQADSPSSDEGATFAERYVSESGSFVPSKSKLKLNCTPVYRDASNMTASLVLVNVSTISNYLQLKVMPSSLEMSATVVISGAVSLATADAVTVATSIAPADEEQGSSPSGSFIESLVSGENMAADAGPGMTPTTPTSTTSAPGQCTLLVFYLDWCPFTAKAAAHFNAIGRLYPQLNILAIDAYTVYGTTMRYGVVGVPSAYLFHNNKLVSRYNHSEVTVENLVEYLKRLTQLDPVGEVVVTEEDLLGPLSSIPVTSLNYTLISAWAFCLLVAAYYFARSDLFRRAKEQVLHMWNEAQFQHEHVD